MMDKQLNLNTGAYALDALDNDERADFERYALTDPQAADEARSLAETAALLAFGTEEEAPPAQLKTDLMAAIRTKRQLAAPSEVRDISSAKSRAHHGRSSRSAKGNRWMPALSAAAALVVFAGVVGWVVGQNTTDTHLQKRLVALEDKQATAQAQQEAMLGIVSSSDAKIATTEMADGASVTVASSGKANQAAVLVQGMAELPADKTYELWFISAAGAVPAGLMQNPGSPTPGLQVLDGPLDGATHVGITVEPAGGSPAPTTPPLLVQAL
ncbi:anti-sigma factor [Arthrobacter sp. H35-D1]|uniref:anti-sigma factor n=1 Tax=Arthrobacter sp. H35-D1 TaxID=3046202 RepID=UPI0024BBE646|nr:anti-sigma factor [Arthrobacter sp. H35-D1]MDJ0314115.1 anti-sigma factor [Arthrobacter sp. H35-D1]